MNSPAPLIFHTSRFGRFGHIAMALPVLGMSALFGGALVLRVVAIDDVWAWLGALVLFLASTWVAIYCIYFGLKRGERVLCTPTHLVYRGLLRTLEIPWSNITEFWIDFAGQSPFVFLVVRAGRRPYSINMSGLRPSYLALFALVRRMARHAKCWTPRGYEMLEKMDSALGRVLAESIVDDPLTLVRADGPQAGAKRYGSPE